MPEKKKKTDLIIGADHAGFEMKETIQRLLSALKIHWEDAGTFSKDSVDYPDIAFKVAEAVKSGRARRGILVCGTGVGMSMAANKVPGIRAALCNDLFTARMARAHNNANILTIGSRVIGPGLAEMIVRTFLETPFEKGR
ncbi:MAG: ribose 5-phosphate isomerase B, partial [Thermodesulfobacteriota bacterium]